MMDIDDCPIIYGLEYQARSLTGLYGDDESVRFLVGTQSLRLENQIHLVSYNEESKQISKHIFSHSDGEIWDLTVTPSDPQLFVSTYCRVAGNDVKMRAQLYRIPDDLIDQTDDLEDSMKPIQLEPICVLPTEEHGDVRKVISHPNESDSSLICLVDNHIVLCNNKNNSGYVQSGVGTLEGRNQPKLTAGRWNPHHGSTQIATASDLNVKGWDLRSMKQSFSIDSAHSQVIRDLDYNPNRQYYLTTCGDDCLIKFWDIRRTTQPLLQLQTHSHWVWTVRYNPFHDQLLISGSSDSRVCLHNCREISSEHVIDSSQIDSPDQGDDGHDLSISNESLADGLIRVFEEHEDSVYATEWSLVDPWIFASLSYDGRLVINQVPKFVKFKILL